MSDDELLSIMDQYLADIIEHVIYKYNYNVDLDEEYEDLLRYILRRLIKTWFNGVRPRAEELEAALKRARRKPKHLEVLISYLISRYAAKHGQVYLERKNDWEERI